MYNSKVLSLLERLRQRYGGGKEMGIPNSGFHVLYVSNDEYV